MDWDLWSSSFDQGFSGDIDDDYSEHPEWQYGFYFGRDVIEENALNEASCIQVLRILITNADTEIEGLEKDLLSLQNELAWTEHEKWSEICCSALTERINSLDVAISTLKNDHADETEVQLLLDNKPAETLHEILEALQRDHCQDTHGQQLDVNILKPIVNDTEHGLDKDSSSVDSNIIIKEEGMELYGTTENSKSSELLLELHEKSSNDKELYGTSENSKGSELILELHEKSSNDKELYGTSENSKSSELILELHGKSSNDPEKIEELLVKSPVTSPDLGAICCAPDHSDGMKLSGTPDNKVTENEELGRSQLITTDTSQIANLFPSKGNGIIPREVKVQEAICCAPDHSDGMKLSATTDNKVIENEEVRRSQLITTGTSQIVNLFPSKGNGDIPREVKKENVIDKEKDVSSDDFRIATGAEVRVNCLHSRFGASQHRKCGNSDLDRKLCDFAPKVTENEEIRRSQLITTDTSQTVNLFPSKGNGDIPREVKKENVIDKEKDVSSDDFRIATGAEGRENCLHSRFGASQHRKSRNSDLDRKLCDFAPKVTENEEIRRSQLITTDTSQIVNLFPSKGNGNIPREVKKENAIDKDVSSDDFRFATGVEGRENCLHSRLGASQHRKTGNSDLDRKLCDFAPKTARRACKKESKVAPAEDLDSMKLPLQVVYPQELCLADSELCSFKGSDGNNSEQMMNIENTSFINAESSALISLLEMQTKSVLYTGLHLTDEEKQQAQGLKSKIAANLNKSNMIFPSKLKAQGKRKAELVAFSSREQLDNPIEVDPITTIVVSTKRQQKSKSTACLNESMNRAITKRAVQPGQEQTEGHAIVLYDSEFSELQNKMSVSKRSITAGTQNSTVNLDVLNSNRVSKDNGSQENLASHLKSLTLKTLKSMAKQHNVRKYYQLQKGALVEQLVERLRNR